jgi:hypothetical protein
MHTAHLEGLRLVSLANAREHWKARQRRTRLHRGGAYGRLLEALAGARPMLPAVVTITRIAPCRLDSDNLATACKSIRDGVADAIGLDDRDPRVEWRYEQERAGVRVYGVRLEVDSLGHEPAPAPLLLPWHRPRVKRSAVDGKTAHGLGTRPTRPTRPTGSKGARR